MPADEHLRAALRHAPDAKREAPSALSAQIRATARAALANEGTAWHRLWAWLGRPLHLGASGASGVFATLLLAGVLTLMWRGEAPAPVVEQRREAVSPAPPPRSVAAPTPAPAPAPPVAATPAAPTAAAKTVARTAARPATPAPDAPAATLPATPPPVAETATRANEAKVVADASGAEARPAPSGPLVPAAPAPAADARSRAALSGMRAAAPSADIATWLDAATERPSAATSMAAPGAPADARKPATALLRELQSFSAGRWQDSSVPEGSARFELWQAGRRSASLWLNDDGAIVCLTPAQRCQRAPLAPAQIETLRAALTR